MKTKQIIETNVDEMPTDYFGTDFSDTWELANTEANIIKMAKKYSVSSGLIDDIAEAFRFLAEELKSSLAKDLKDIWERLDEIERKVN